MASTTNTTSSNPPPVPQSKNISLASRIRGALYGLAVTDALGGPVEFCWRGAFEPVTGMRYNGNFNLPPGSWTDDTSMTLCLARSLVDLNGEMDLWDQARNYVKWMREGYMSSVEGKCFDIGNATRVALGHWRQGLQDLDSREREQTAKMKNEAFLSSSGMAKVNAALNKEQSCGNGSLMRCIPIPLVYHNDPARAQENAELASLPTHPHRTCIEACQVYTGLVTTILNAGSGPEPSPSKLNLADDFHRHKVSTSAMTELCNRYKSPDDWLQRPESSISSSGFVVHTLEAALWAFFTTDTFREGALRVVNLGDDADTVGAVYGGIAGAWYGMEAIPDEWLAQLRAREVLDPVFEGVVSLVTREKDR